MKSLADFKRRMVPGQIVEKTFHIHHAKGRTTPLPTRQRVHTAQKTSVGFEMLEGDKVGQVLWLDYPKAKNLKFIDEDTAEVWNGETLILTYKFI